MPDDAVLERLRGAVRRRRGRRASRSPAAPTPACVLAAAARALGPDHVDGGHGHLADVSGRGARGGRGGWPRASASSTWSSRRSEFDDPRFVENSRERCYYCKAGLLDALAEVAARHGGAALRGRRQRRRRRRPPSRHARRRRARRAAAAAGRRDRQGRGPAAGASAWACPPGTRRSRPAWPRASPTASPSRRTSSPRWPTPSGRCASSASASAACATTATWRAIEVEPDELERALRAARRDLAAGPRRRVHLRGPRRGWFPHGKHERSVIAYRGLGAALRQDRARHNDMRR